MDTAIINIKIEPAVKKQAQKLAADLGLSLSSVIKAYLKQFLRTKTISLSTVSEEPSDYLIKALKESREDIKAGSVVSFESGKDALTYLDSMIHDKQKSSKN
jgi:addiction module RelB/DinJ family antitoxin